MLQGIHYHVDAIMAIERISKHSVASHAMILSFRFKNAKNDFGSYLEKK